MCRFSLISTIKTDNPASYEGKVFLSLDIDWAHDDILLDSIELIEDAGASATWYVTHDTPLLNRLRENPNFELGIHPNFNFLLEGDSRNGRDAGEVLDRLLEIVPEAKSVRSHSLTQSEKLLDLFANRGLTHVGNTYIPSTSNMRILPWQLWSGLVVVPHCFQDNAEFRIERNGPNPIKDGLIVLNFHPIHIFLNTENINRYELTRPWHRNSTELINHRSEHMEGTRMLLKQLLKDTKL